MANLTLQDFRSVYSFLQRQAPEAAAAFRDSLVGFSEMSRMSEVGEKKAKLTPALQKWGEAVKAVQERKNHLQVLTPGSLLKELSVLTPDTMRALFPRVLAVVRNSLTDPNQVESQLEQEAAPHTFRALPQSPDPAPLSVATPAPTRLSVHAKLTNGLVALFELVMKRPGISLRYPVLATLAAHLNTLLRSFSEQRSDGVSKDEGIANLRVLAKLIRRIKEELQQFYANESPAKYFIEQLLALENQLPTFYNLLQTATKQAIGTPETDTVDAEQIFTFFHQQAEELSNTLRAAARRAQREASLTQMAPPPSSEGLAPAAEPRPMDPAAGLSLGLAGLYEMVMHRPNLQYRLTNGGIDRKFLLQLKLSLNKLIPTFGDANKEKAGIQALKTLTHLVSSYFDSIKDLYILGSETGYLIGLLNTQINAAELYRQMNGAIVTAASEDLISQWISNRSLEISQTIPAYMKGDTSTITRRTAAAFEEQQDHGQGALLFGQWDKYTYASQWFGDGPNASRTYTRGVEINAFEPLSVETIGNRKGIAKMQEKTQEVVDNYLNQHRLSTKIYIADTGSEHLQETELDNPDLHAIATIYAVVDYLLAQEKKKYLLGLEPSQLEALRPAKNKEAVLFGLKHDIFSASQFFALGNEFPTIWNEREIRDEFEQSQSRIDSRQALELENSYLEESAGLRDL